MKLLPLLSLSALLAIPACAVEISLAQTNITMPWDRRFQMPITASDPSGAPLKFSVVSVKPKALFAKFAPRTNRSLLLNVSGVDSNGVPFTGDLVLQLFDDLTSNTTARITKLVNSGFYTGQTFHRVIQNFICQAGNTNGTSGVRIDDEYSTQLTYIGFGQLGLAKTSDFFGNTINDTGDSEIYITDVDLSLGNPLKPPPRFLDLKYPIFGQLTRGFDVLSALMTTPVSGESPLTPVIINSAAIIKDSQAVVLRLFTIYPTWTGTVEVTVSAMNATKQKAKQTFTVNIVSNPANDPPFIGPVPASLLITQSMAAAFPFTFFQLDNDQPQLGLRDADTGQVPTNIDATVDASQRLWLVPDATVTGTVNLAITLGDNINPPDSQHCSLTIVPKPAAPTMTPIPKRGTIISGISSNDNRITISGSLVFGGPSDHSFTFQDIVILDIGDPGNPLHVTLWPDEPGFSAKKEGVIKFKSAKKDAPPKVSAQFNSKKGSFKIGVSNFNFPAAISNQVQVGITVGNDYGSDTRAWVESKPGTFTLPKP